MNALTNYINSLDQGLVFYTILVLAFILLRIPGLNNYLRTVNTLLHESGHALVAILLSGEAIEIKLNSNTSGSALTRTNSKIKAFLVSFAGYPLAAMGALGLMALSYNQNYRTGFFILISISIINLVVFVRNTYGIFWLATFSILLFVSNWYLTAPIAMILFWFISLIAFIEGITSTFGVVVSGMTHPKKAGDITSMVKFSGVPAFFWSIFMAIIVGSISWITVISYFPSISQLFN
jgi:hypothetical protein